MRVPMHVRGRGIGAHLRRERHVLEGPLGAPVDGRVRAHAGTQVGVGSCRRGPGGRRCTPSSGSARTPGRGRMPTGAPSRSKSGPGPMSQRRNLTSSPSNQARKTWSPVPASASPSSWSPAPRSRSSSGSWSPLASSLTPRACSLTRQTPPTFWNQATTSALPGARHVRLARHAVDGQGALLVHAGPTSGSLSSPTQPVTPTRGTCRSRTPSRRRSST